MPFDLTIADLQPQDLNRYDVDLWIMALPDGESPRFINAIPSHKRVIDLSAEHRLNPSWVYGLSETNSSKIDAPRVLQTRVATRPVCT